MLQVSGFVMELGEVPSFMLIHVLVSQARDGRISGMAREIVS